ncbi:MAG TPA: DUF3822 family protein [Salinimicrobium sp.]|nr:DUF3822 family protein [Salinimicrobium sp.]
MPKQQINTENHNLKLSIQVDLNGLSFCGLNTNANKIVFFKDEHFRKKLNPEEVLQKIETIFKKENFLQKNFDEVLVLFSNELYSIVPKTLFKEENASDYLKFNTKILENDFVAQDYLDREMVNVYIPFANINNYFFDIFGEFEYRHCVSVLAQEFLELNKDQKEGTKVYLNNHTWGYDLVIIKNGKLLFANSFLCGTKEDFIYYILFTAEQLDLDPNKFELVLLGHIAQASEYYKMAYTYVKNISFLDTAFGFDYEAGNTPPKGYNYYPLFKILQS